MKSRKMRLPGRWKATIGLAGILLSGGLMMAMHAGPADAQEGRAPEDMEFVLVEGGRFQMGLDAPGAYFAERPAHAVRVNSFYLSRTEVTVAQYRKFCEATGRTMPEAPDWGWQDNHPVVKVTWSDAEAYCRWAGGRLPTEAEYEYAAKGGKLSRGYLYSGSNNVNEAGWYDLNSGGKTHPVGLKKANELGLFDMSGNAWEWCSDWWDGTYYSRSPEDNPAGAETGSYRVLRGGSYHFATWLLRCACRHADHPGNRLSNIGFRCAKDL